jgi:hypothetical protein
LKTIEVEDTDFVIVYKGPMVGLTKCYMGNKQLSLITALSFSTLGKTFYPEVKIEFAGNTGNFDPDIVGNQIINRIFKFYDIFHKLPGFEIESPILDDYVKTKEVVDS